MNSGKQKKSFFSTFLLQPFVLFPEIKEKKIIVKPWTFNLKIIKEDVDLSQIILNLLTRSVSGKTQGETIFFLLINLRHAFNNLNKLFDFLVSIEDTKNEKHSPLFMEYFLLFFTLSKNETNSFYDQKRRRHAKDRRTKRLL